MAIDVLARVLLPTNDTRVDTASIGLHFINTSAPGSDVNLTTAQAKIVAFFNTLNPPQSTKMCQYLSSVIKRTANACSVEYYNITGHLDGTPAGSPISIQTFTLGAGAGSQSQPEEVAAVCNYRVDYGTDVEFGVGTRPRSRDRNRFYLGPLSIFGLDQDSTTFASKLNAVFASDIQSALLLLMARASSDATCAVWSRKDAVLKHPITMVGTRDTFVSQRRRQDVGVEHQSPIP